MAFADPQTVTVNSVARVMARILNDGTSAVYQSADESWKLSISHTTSRNGRTRTQVRFDQRAVVSNPLDSSNDYDTLTYYTVIDRPAYGFSMVQVEQIVAGLNAWLTNATVDKLYGKES